jgi:hypothetical protein
MAELTYPGVYINEFEPAAPIVGVGTSTAAFLGPAADGPVLEPKKITNWKAFLDNYAGAKGLPLDGAFYLWYAVRGFFENGGAVCYVVRVSNAGFDSVELTDRATDFPGPPPAPAADQKTLVIRARTAGDLNPPIAVQVTNSNVLPSGANGARVYRPGATIQASGSDYLQADDADDARRFMRGDEITWAGIGAHEVSPAVVDHVDGKRIFLQAALVDGPYNAGAIRLADLVHDRSRVFRLDKGGELLGAGSVVTLTQAASGANPAVSETGVVQSVQLERIPATLTAPGFTTHRITLRKPVGQDVSLTRATPVSSPVFGIVVDRAAAGLTPVYHQDYTDLSMDPLHPRYFATVVAADDKRIVDAESYDPPDSWPPPPYNQPRATVAAQNLGGGAAEDLQALNVADYQRALETLESIDDVNFAAIPDRQDADVQLALLAHCERMKDRVAIFDSRRGLPPFGPGSVETQRASLDSGGGYGALYYPWLQVADASGNGHKFVPPSGHMAGVWARTDEERGVHKSPAGEKATVSGAIGVSQPMSDIDQGQLNLKGINVIRVFKPGGRPVVWGARTTATDTVWQYLSVRRLFLYLEESVADGIAWAVFEPNNLQLWQGLKRTIGDFLEGAWRDGALFGDLPKHAFYVRIDDVLNPFSEQALGRLHIEIGARPAYPAEFIVVRIGIWDGGSEVTES